MQAKSLQSCPTLFDPVDCSPPGSSVHGDSPGKDNRVGWHFLLLSGEIPGLKNRYSCQHAVTSVDSISLIHSLFKLAISHPACLLKPPSPPPQTQSWLMTLFSISQKKYKCQRGHAPTHTPIPVTYASFPTQGSNPGLLHCRQTLYHLSHQGSPSDQ